MKLYCYFRITKRTVLKHFIAEMYIKEVTRTYITLLAALLLLYLVCKYYEVSNLRPLQYLLLSEEVRSDSATMLVFSFLFMANSIADTNWRVHETSFRSHQSHMTPWNLSTFVNSVKYLFSQKIISITRKK